MQRRDFLLSTAASAAALFASTLAHAQTAPNFLLPLKGVNDETGVRDCAALEIEGRMPAGLNGRFLRNGPALFERGGVRYQHWFDGDGMVQQYRFENGQVAHRGRLVQTRKYQAERRAGEFLVPTFGTAIQPKLRITGPDSLNPANTNAIEHGGRILAMWEGGSAHELDAQTLETKGVVTWSEGMEQVPFSAHPKVDSAGHLWNVGLGFNGQLAIWHVGPHGKLIKAGRVKLPFVVSMAHDMAVTERFIVVPLPPLRMDFSKLGQGVEKAFAFDKNQPMRVVLIDKSDFTQMQIFESPAEMLFHVGNAYETTDGQVELTYVGSPDISFLTGQATAIMRGEAFNASPTTLALLRLDPKTGKLERRAISNGQTGVEFPRVNPRFVGERARYLLTPEARDTGGALGFNHLRLWDLESGKSQVHVFSRGQVVEEFVSVPKPGSKHELDAWLIGSGFDAVRQVSTVHVFDARGVGDGPIATARLPYWVPFGFHGNFQAA